MPISIFKTHSPLAADDQAWMEFRLQWLVERAGIERLQSTFTPVDLNLEIHFNKKEKYKRINEHAQLIARKLKIHIEPFIVQVVHANTANNGIEGFDFESNTIFVSKVFWQQQQVYIRNTVCIVAAFFCSRLFTDAHSDVTMSLVELTAIFLGFGLSIANHTTVTKYSVNRLAAGEYLHRHGSLTALQAGAAIGTLLNACAGKPADWINDLCPDAQSGFQKSSRFAKQNPNRFFSERSIYERKIDSVTEFEPLIRSRDPVDLILALRHCTFPEQLSEFHKKRIATLLRHNHPGVQSAAIFMMTSDPELTRSNESELIEMSYSKHASVRESAIIALNQIELSAEAIEELRSNFLDTDPDVVLTAASIASQQTQHSNYLVPLLTEALHYWLAQCNFGIVHELCHAIVANDDNAEAWLFERFDDGQADFLHLALEAYQNARAEQAFVKAEVDPESDVPQE